MAKRKKNKQRSTKHYTRIYTNKLLHQPLNLFLQAVFMYWLGQTID